MSTGDGSSIGSRELTGTIQFQPQNRSHPNRLREDTVATSEVESPTFRFSGVLSS